MTVELWKLLADIVVVSSLGMELSVALINGVRLNSDLSSQDGVKRECVLTQDIVYIGVF